MLESGTLYILATPIGNLKDISFRAIETLKNAYKVYAEDTRQTYKLFSEYEISNVLIDSYHQQSPFEKRLQILNELNSGKNIVLVTDAGTPGISDPGNELIDFLLAQNKEIKIVCVPGASALTAAISISGFDASRFTFLGFLPKKKKKKLFKEVFAIDQSVVFFESPFRIAKTLGDLTDFMQSRKLCVCMELTKVYERVYRGSLDQVKEKITNEQDQLGRAKGEIVVVVSNLLHED